MIESIQAAAFGTDPEAAGAVLTNRFDVIVAQAVAILQIVFECCKLLIT